MLLLLLVRAKTAATTPTTTTPNWKNYLAFSKLLFSWEWVVARRRRRRWQPGRRGAAKRQVYWPLPGGSRAVRGDSSRRRRGRRISRKIIHLDCDCERVSI